MSDVKLLSTDSGFFDLLGDLPVSTLLAYVYESWVGYAGHHTSSLPALQRRTEPQLTQALAAFLRQRQDAGEQPFAGDFFGELSEFTLDKVTGLPKCVSRTDIEWRLYGLPGFVIEFKVLDGKSARREKYLMDGVMRFVSGRYSGGSTAGAMFALLRKSAKKDPNLIQYELQNNGSSFHCICTKSGSDMLPTIALFDSTHKREPPHFTPFQLAHVFVPLP